MILWTLLPALRLLLEVFMVTLSLETCLGHDSALKFNVFSSHFIRCIFFQNHIFVPFVMNCDFCSVRYKYFFLCQAMYRWWHQLTFLFFIWKIVDETFISSCLSFIMISLILWNCHLSAFTRLAWKFASTFYLFSHLCALLLHCWTEIALELLSLYSST